MSVYEHPEYYDIAFSYRDVSSEVDFFDACREQFATGVSDSVLELACGPTPYMTELADRGYDYAGLDRSPEMLDYARTGR
jgi:SAM-dependent methyltransferase